MLFDIAPRLTNAHYSLLAFSAEVISYKLKKGGKDTVYGVR